MFSEDIYKTKMSKALEVFNKELSSLRTGRANANMLDLIKVDVYGQKMPINQLGTVTTPESRVINIQVWDLNNVNLIDSSIKKSDLGLNPQIDGQLIRLPIPNLSEERRTEMKKMIKTMGEKCKVSVRNIRKGERVGYGGRKKASKDMRIAIVYAGYADGIPQTTADGTKVLVNDKQVEIFGRVSMDLVSIDVTNLPQVSENDLVLFWSEELPINEFSNKNGLISYELMTRINSRVKVKVI